jgi:hypothetical protein
VAGTMSGSQRQFVLLGTLAMSLIGWGQRLPQFGTVTPVAVLLRPAMVQPVNPPCAKSVDPFDVDDYNGPLNQLVARFSQKVDRVTVHAPRRHTSLKPCSLSAGEKFRLFVDDSIDPVNFVGAAWSAGLAQADRDDRAFGQGATGYSQRFAAAVADNATGDFFGIFLYPAIFHQDPRYYRVGHGSAESRIGHALEHPFIAHSDSGKRMFNYSEWFSTVSSKLVTNLYHPGNPRGFGPTASRVGFSIAGDMGWDVLREFWPEVAHKFRLPFRTHEEFYAAKTPSAREPLQPSAPPATDTPAPEATH